MRQRIDPDGRLTGLADAQAGMVSRSQAFALGMTVESVRRLVEGGWWRRASGGLYYCRPDPPPWLALAWGGILLGGDHARLGGEAAAHLHELSRTPPEVIEVLVPHGTRRVPRDVWQFVQERDRVRRNSRGSPPRLDVEDCVLDLCAVADPGGVVDVVTTAIQSRRTTADRLARRLEERSRHPQRELLRTLLVEVAAGSQSPLELRYLREVERPHGLPQGRRQDRSRGTFRDVFYEDYATVVELDGREGHQGLDRHRDLRRDNRSTVAGESTLRYGWHDVVECPCLVAAQVGSVLRQRGWSGTLALCPRCEVQRRSE